MSDEAGLLLAIREHPSDDLPRLAWADWLEENGRSERAELVRLQLALARGDESGRPREQALLAEHGQRWLDAEAPGFAMRTTHEWLRRPERDIPPSAAFRRGVPSVFFVKLVDLPGFRVRPVAPARFQLLDKWPHQTHGGWWWNDDFESDESVLTSDLDDCLLEYIAYSSLNDALVGLSRACTLSLFGRGRFPRWKERWSPKEVGEFLPSEGAQRFNWDRAKSASPDSDYYSISREGLLACFRDLGCPVDHLISPWSGDLESVR